MSNREGRDGHGNRTLARAWTYGRTRVRRREPGRVDLEPDRPRRLRRDAGVWPR